MGREKKGSIEKALCKVFLIFRWNGQGVEGKGVETNCLFRAPLSVDREEV